MKLKKMNLTQLREWLSWFPNNNNPEDKYGDKIKPFEPGKRLCERDYVIIDMLNSQGHDAVSFCVTDPNQPDNPVIYISEVSIKSIFYPNLLVSYLTSIYMIHIFISGVFTVNRI